MFKRYLPVFFCGLLLLMLLMLFSTPAMAAPSLSWHTDTVYCDSQNRIVIEGYFFNNGSHTVTWVNRFDVQVYFRQAATDWWQQASASYYDLNVYLNPGDSLRWTFRITNVSNSYFDYWNVKGNVNYQYR